jgi:type IX secretion system PorP/SprF family membrane protein
MKKILILFIFSNFISFSYSQQIALHSQYMLDMYMINPAVAGSYDFIPVSANFRQQWVGFNGAPVTQTLTAHGYVGKNVGLGIGFFNEVSSPSRRTGMNVSFAYHVPMSSDFTRKLSFGISPVFFQHYINRELLTTYEPDDPAIMQNFNNQFCPDVNFGVMFTQDQQYYAGISFFNLLQIRRDLFQIMDRIDNPIQRTYYFLGGYMFHAGEDFIIEPSAHVQYQFGTPFQVDGNLRIVYKNRIGLGCSYRHDDALAYMLLVNFGTFRFGYSYDMTLSDMADHSFGSHEFHVAYRIFGNKKTSQSSGTIPMFY